LFEFSSNGEPPPEGRDWTEELYRGFILGFSGNSQEPAGELDAEYSWPSRSSTFTATYLIRAILTDDGVFVGGGCAQRSLIRDLASHNWAGTNVYEFAHRNGPGPLATTMKQWWGSFVSRGVPKAPAQNT